MVKKRGRISHKRILIKNKKHHLIRHKQGKHKKEKIYDKVKHLFDKEKNSLIEHFEISKQERKEEPIERKTALPFGILFLLSLVLYILAFLMESLISAVISVILMFSSLTLYRTGKRVMIFISRYLSLLYLLVWISGIMLFAISFIKRNVFSAAIALLVIFFCSLAATFLHKKKKMHSLKAEINDLRSLGKYTTDFDIVLILLKKYKKLKVIQLIEGFNMDKDVVEGWIDTLEQHRLLKVRFPVFSGMEIIIPEDDKKEEIKKNNKR